jgi:hypothetical protein
LGRAGAGGAGLGAVELLPLLLA